VTGGASQRRPVVAVIGSAGQLPIPVEDSARELGRLIMDRGFRLVTGGLGGVMAAASRGAREAESWQEGRVVGVLPGYDRAAANPWCDVVIPTGSQLARNVVVVSMADVVIAVAGGSGTLSEMALAWQLGRPIVALESHGGWAAELAGRRLDDRHREPIARAGTPAQAVERARALCSVTRPEAGDVGSGWRGQS